MHYGHIPVQNILGQLLNWVQNSANLILKESFGCGYFTLFQFSTTFCSQSNKEKYSCFIFIFIVIHTHLTATNTAVF